MNIDKKFLLVCLQLIIVLVMSMIVEGNPNVDAPIESSNPLQQLLSSSKKSIVRGNLNQRAFRLYHRCSFREVVIQDRVSTTANTTDRNGDLVLETMMKNDTIKIRIRGWLSGKYVCYNRRGRLIAKPREKARGAKCDFKEDVVPGGESCFRSIYNSDWVIGFNRNGQPISGPGSRRPNQDCFKFLKTDSPLSGYDYFRRNEFNVDEHNRRVGRKRNGAQDASYNYPSRLMRHRKKSHRHRDRRTHLQSDSAADR